MFEIRTDLAVEEKESFPGNGGLFAFSGSSTKLIKFSYSMFIFSDKMHIIIISITILFHAISIIAHFVSNSTKYR